ncbi:MAG: hypothetical protein R2710_14805 [Acidimicrobiales bacterium]
MRQAELPGAPGVDMRFYRGDEGHHHDLALVQIPNPRGRWCAAQLGHVHRHPRHRSLRLGVSDRDSWLAQIEYLQNEGVEFAIRGNHGMTHSAYVVDPDGHGVEVLYDLPQEVWEGDVDAALSYFEVLPTTGPESLLDDNDYATFGTNQ